MNPNPRTDMSTTEIPTPLTDAAEYTNFNGAQVTPYVDAEMARDLERRLHAALAREQALREALQFEAERCPVCGGLGHTMHGSTSGQPTQHQCERCAPILSILSTTPTA
jgi:hypothetical protein